MDVTIEEALLILLTSIVIGVIIVKLAPFFSASSPLTLKSYAWSAYAIVDGSEYRAVANIHVFCGDTPLRVDWIAVAVSYPDGGVMYRVSNGGRYLDKQRQVLVQAKTDPAYICMHGEKVADVSVYVTISKASPLSRVDFNKIYITAVVLGGDWGRKWSTSTPVSPGRV